MQGACKGSAGVWSTSARTRQFHGLVSPCAGGVHASSDALSCGASWPMLGGTICALGNLRNLKDLWGKQNPTPKQQAWGILGRLGAACLVLSLCVDNWHGMQHMEICSSARLLLQPL